jgi:hypothetical protein
MGSSDQDRHQLGDSEPVGLAILAALEDASRQSMAERERAIEAAHILSDRLRAAEGHAKQLETEIEGFRQRAFAVEKWLVRIQAEIQNKFLIQPSPVGASASRG